MRGCEVSRRAPDARRDGGKTRFIPQGDFRTEIAILYYFSDTSLVGEVGTNVGCFECPAGRSGNPVAESFRLKPGIGTGQRRWNEWAGEAKWVGRDALFCSLFEGWRGKNSPPAAPEGRTQICAIEARVRHGLPGNFLHRTKN